MTMKSVTIKDFCDTVLLKIYHKNGAFWVDRLSSTPECKVIIKDKNNHRVTISSINKSIK